jgi:hypothetical protein
MRLLQGNSQHYRRVHRGRGQQALARGVFVLAIGVGQAYA